MKRKIRSSISAILAMIISVSAGLAVGGTLTSEEMNQNGRIDTKTAAGANSSDRTDYLSEQTQKSSADTTAQSSTSDGTPITDSGTAELTNTTLTREFIEQELADTAKQEPVQYAAAPVQNEEASPVKIIGKSYEELYPDYVVGDYIFSDNEPDEDELIKDQDEYFDSLNPNGGRSYRAVVLPSSVDNSQSEYFPEVDTQGGLGSCTCWSMVYYQFTYEFNRNRHITTTKANTFTPRFEYNLICGADGKNGADVNYVYPVMKKFGCLTWEEFPYDGKDCVILPSGADIYKKAATRKLQEYYQFATPGDADRLVTSPDDEDILAIKTSLANNEILTFATSFSSFRADHLKALNGNPSINSGIVGEEVVLSCDGTKGGHQMTIVGYNDNIWVDLNGNDAIDAGEMGAFKIVNSHGKGYANQGFAWVAYDALNYRSCVEGAYNAPDRTKIFSSICRIDVKPETYVPSSFVEYTVNTDDRYHTSIDLIATWANTTVTESIDLDCFWGSAGYYAYDGSKTATDSTVAFDLGYITDKLKAPNIDEVTWDLKVGSDTKNGHAITIKDFKMYDEANGYSYNINNSLPVTVLNDSKTLPVHQAVENNAIIYYRGYKDPVIKYALGSSTNEKEETMWFNDKEQYGYVNKFVISLGTYTSARVRIGNGSGTWDDNGGKYFTVKKGDNFIVTENVGEPLEIIKAKHHLESSVDLGCTDQFDLDIKGGYTPYRYRYVVKDTRTNEIETETEYKEALGYRTTEDPDVFAFNYVQYKYQKETSYRVYIYIMDAAGEVKNSSFTITIVDEPLTIKEFKIENSKSVYNCNDTLSFYWATENDSNNGGNCNAELMILKNNTPVHKGSYRMKSYYGNFKKCSHSVDWTPTEGGDYTAVVGRVDADGFYTYKTLDFKVATSDLKFNSVTVSPDGDLGAGEKLTVSANVSGGDGTYQFQYAYYRYDTRTVASDFSGNSTGSVQLPFETGPYKVEVTVKDGSGKTATYTKDVTLSQGRIKNLSADKTTLYTNETIKISAETKNVAASLTSGNYFYTATLNGQTTTLTTNADKSASWKPTQAGEYNIKLMIKIDERVLAVSSKKFTVAVNPKPQEYKLRIGVVYYIDDANSATQFKVHYWNNSGVVGDAACVKTSETALVSVGSEYWSGQAQKFYIYEATVPITATGYKFHIGDRWFGDDGSLSTSNAAYIFEYGSVDRAMYRKEAT